MRSDVLIAHPYKHHALNLAAGLVKSGRQVAMAFPLYRSGLGRLIACVPGPIGRKASGYFHPGLKDAIRFQSSWWQFRKLLTFLSDPKEIETPFDEFVAAKISSGAWAASTVVTLQDHMPQTALAAKRAGSRLWSDQIINLSDAAMSRINTHCRAFNIEPQRHDERANTGILEIADIVTVPSAYTYEGVAGRLKLAASYTVPYGVDATRFNVLRAPSPGEFTIVARANSVRKGGHLLLSALLRSHAQLAAYVAPARLRVVILGKCDPALGGLLERARRQDSIVIEDGNVPNIDVPALFASAHLFVMPTLSESMSLACIEAMQAGLPLLVTKYAGIDVFVDGEMGVLVDDSIESLTEGLSAALARRKDLAAWGERARSAASMLGWERYETQIAEITAQHV